jgi:hypothetical protein
MLMKEFRLPAVLAAALAALAVSALPAAAQSVTGTGSRVPAPPPAPSAPAPESTRFEDAVTQRSMIVQQVGRQAIVKFEDTSEVMILQSVPAPRGDTFLRNDKGEVMFRMTEQGNLVSYMDNAIGVPAVRVGPATALSVPPMAASLDQLRSNAAKRLSKLAGHDVTIFGAAEFAANEDWVTDVLGNVVSGAEMANGQAGRIVAELNKVRLARGTEASVSYSNGELLLGVNPSKGEAGHPSADQIARSLATARAGN